MPQGQNAEKAQGAPQSYWLAIRKIFLKSAIISSVSIQILFLACICYFYGTAYRSNDRASNLQFLMVDYDQGIVGESLRVASSRLMDPSFPTIQEQDSGLYPDPTSIEQAVCQGDFWAAAYVQPGASQRLADALQGGSAAANYDPTTALEMVWNEIRYPASTQSYVTANLQVLSAATKSIYYSLNGSATLQSFNSTDLAAQKVLFNPIEYSTTNLAPASQGTRFLYNTVSSAMIILMQFFFILSINGMMGGMQIYQKVSTRNIIVARFGLSLVHSFASSLVSVGYIWAFKEDWNVGGAQYIESWMAIWLVMHVNFLVIDAIAARLPMPYVPFFIITWILMQVASTTTPLEVSAGFYRIGYAWPAHNLYEMLVFIWSRGCTNRLYRNLPITFSWWLVGFCASLFAQLRKCRISKKLVVEDVSVPSERTGSEEVKRATDAGGVK